MLTLARLKETVDYDPETGVFKRKTTSKWNQRSNGKEITTKDTGGYIVFKIDGKMYKAHRLAWMYSTGDMPASWIDHINRNRSDNRFVNLREATCKQNNENKCVPRNNKSGVVGVRQIKRSGLWRAYIYHHRKNIYLGEYSTMSEAVLARLDAVSKLHTHAVLDEARA